MTNISTVDETEVSKFEALASEWWDPNGKFGALHQMNPIRLDYITRQIAAEFGLDLKQSQPLAGIRILDIGCGGGLLTEPLARLGATMIGVDAAAANIPVAKLHATAQDLDIDYRNTTAEALAASGEAFDVVIAMEIIEHVADPQAFLRAAYSLVRKDGLFVCSTLNKTKKSFALAVVGAEYILGWVPKGTHDWTKFITPADLEAMMSKAGLEPVDLKGFVYNPFTALWRMSDTDLSINYVATALRRG